MTYKILLAALFMSCVAFCDECVGATNHLVVRRFDQNPIIRKEMLPGTDGDNINGPSLIRVPLWVTNRLGNYYLYFAHHSGKYIRLAYADDLKGPWKIHEEGALRLEDAPGCKGHIASPDVIVDEAAKTIRMYFHGPANAVAGQKTFVALSQDGLNFKASDEVLGIFYWRVFRWNDAWYRMGKGGLLYRSKDGLTRFEEGPNPFPNSEQRDRDYNGPGPRHVAVHRSGRTLWIYYSNIGDAPERILRTHFNLAGDWKGWKTTVPEEVVRPTGAEEGEDLPVKPSAAGAMKGRENALRDPGIFVDLDGRLYLLYSIAGEAGISIAELIEAR